MGKSRRWRDEPIGWRCLHRQPHNRDSSSGGQPSVVHTPRCLAMHLKIKPIREPTTGPILCFCHFLTCNRVRRGEPWYSCVCSRDMYHPALPKNTSGFICITPLLVKLAYFLPPKKIGCDTYVSFFRQEPSTFGRSVGQLVDLSVGRWAAPPQSPTSLECPPQELDSYVALPKK